MLLESILSIRTTPAPRNGFWGRNGVAPAGGVQSRAKHLTDNVARSPRTRQETDGHGRRVLCMRILTPSEFFEPLHLQ
jgi:hypothetical protein